MALYISRMHNADSISARFAKARKHKGINATDLAKAAGVSRGTIYNFEGGERVPDLDTIQRLAAALDVNPSWLTFGHGEDPFAGKSVEEAGAA